MTHDLIQNARGLLPVLQILEADGHSAHLVGGAVRNALMQRPVKDYDIATSAHPEVVQSLFEAEGLSVHPTGIEHGTLTVVCDDEPFEITTWRRDVATDGRRATIRFADHLEEDAARRDFTFNALYMDMRGDIIDPTGQGIVDAAARRVRFIGTAADRIREDALRILRYFRFCATMGAKIDTASSDFLACTVHSNLIDGLSRERVGMEMRNILNATSGLEVIALMEDCGIMDRILPVRDTAIAGQSVIDRALALAGQEAALGLVPCFSRRMAALQVSPPKDDLCLSRLEVKLHNRLTQAMLSEMAPGEIGYRLGADEGEDALCLAAMTGRVSADVQSLEDLRAASDLKVPISAADLIDQFKGPRLGQALRDAEAIWISTRFTAQKPELIAALQHNT